MLAEQNRREIPRYGMRQNMDTDHAAYRHYCQRIIRRMVTHYADHPAVIGWQIDNETASYGAQNHDVFIGFVDWVKARYGTLEALNHARLTAYWGQQIYTQEDLLQQDRAASTGYRLRLGALAEAARHQFLGLRGRNRARISRAGQFILQNFSPGLHVDVDEAGVAKLVDRVAVNPYHGFRDHMNGHSRALNGDFYRSLKGGNFLVTEINAQSIGWDAAHQFPPYDGQGRLDVYTLIASGANMVAYWHWHSLHSGQETYWRGVLGHDLEPNRFYAEVKRTAHELKRLGANTVNLRKRNDVAILYSGDSQTALDIMPITEAGHAPDMLPREKSKSDYQGLLYQLHKSLFDLNVEADFIQPEDEDLSRYKLIVVPASVCGIRCAIAALGRLCGGGWPCAGNVQDRVHRRSRPRPRRACTRPAAAGGRVFLSGIQHHQAAAAAQGHAWRNRFSLGRDDRSGRGRCSGQLRSPLLRPMGRGDDQQAWRRPVHLYGHWLDLPAMSSPVERVVDGAGGGTATGSAHDHPRAQILRYRRRAADLCLQLWWRARNHSGRSIPRPQYRHQCDPAGRRNDFRRATGCSDRRRLCPEPLTAPVRKGSQHGQCHLAQYRQEIWCGRRHQGRRLGHKRPEAGGVRGAVRLRKIHPAAADRGA
ncbi:beta-galactosidase [Devosia sp. A8/3-2]|nr:beta-galactosidase [Devosia sp. A8/3-2]